MVYGIAIFPSEEIQDAANALRKRYDPQYDLISPHITLKSAFTLDNISYNQLVDALEQIAHQVAPFDIQINKVSTFAPVTNTIYFKVEPIPELNTLFEALHSKQFPGKSEFNFVPHITIAQELDTDEVSDVYGTLRMKHVQFTDTIHQFHLCQQNEQGLWSIVNTFNLNSGD